MNFGVESLEKVVSLEVLTKDSSRAKKRGISPKSHGYCAWQVMSSREACVEPASK